MKLLVITSSWPRFVGDYAGHFVREWVEEVGFPATVIVPKFAKDHTSCAEDPTSPTSPSIDVVRVPYAKTARLFYGGGVLANLRQKPWVAAQIPRAFLALLDAALAHAHEADVIVSHWLVPAGLIGATVARACKRPHVAVSHGSDRWLVGAVPFLGARILARSVSLPMGVPAAAAASPLPPTFSRVAFVGRLEREKGLDVLARAMPLVPWLKVTVAGHGSVAAPAGTRSLGAIPTEQVPELLASHDGCVIPSRREGAPRALLEAMMVGRPIVATRVGRIPEIARDGREALLVPPDSPRALADAFTRLREDAALRARLSAAAHERALEFAWPRVATAYRRVIMDAAQ